ncbi:MAG: imidazoleglycerol-phosphate dehydratase HisB [Candidatus Melainabacteria bacterium]|nr:imidazoleglycerol-phosphate dehydratase HisB [Candidatus Melainabacteria bacterium]MBI3307834.1 imidazoleglycerol-phosphate dehydratase HisB [Candidatus Melainabacteria bacterium]
MATPEKLTKERKARIERKTNETSITCSLNIDGTGQGVIVTGIPFFDHMLSALKKHSFIDLELSASGDLEVDAHHTVEDVGIVLGMAFKEALSSRNNITRYADAKAVLDEACIECALDLCTRPYLYYDLKFNQERINNFGLELGLEFWKAFAFNAPFTLHLRQISGQNAHHIIESSFKAFALAFDKAKQIDPRIQGSRSTKGTL